MRYQVVETIGASREPPALHEGRMPRIRGQAPSLGAPRLPVSVLKRIALVAAGDVDAWDDCADNAQGADGAKAAGRTVRAASRGSGRALRIALVCRAWHATVFSQVLLPHVVLTGERQVRAFCAGLENDTAGIAGLAMRCVQSVTVLQHSVDTSIPHGALYDGVANTRRFTQLVDAALQILLTRCLALRRVALQCEPFSLDVRRRESPHVVLLAGVRSRLEELVCLQSPWAGDVADALWLPASPPRPAAPWTSLTHVQLHGPRLRFTTHTALALAQLPHLTHLALVVPSVVRLRNAALQGCPLQALVQHAPHLERLIVVAHRDEHWIGAEQRLRPTLTALVRTVREPEERQVRVSLVVAERVGGVTPWDPSTRVHPGMFSDWVLSRGMRGNAWDYEERGVDRNVAYTNDSWTVPTLVDVPLGGGPQDTPGRAEERTAQQTRRGVAVVDPEELLPASPDESPATSPPGSPPPNNVPNQHAAQLWGIDNVD